MDDKALLIFPEEPRPLALAMAASELNASDPFTIGIGRAADG
jgi:hypothetical protein